MKKKIDNFVLDEIVSIEDVGVIDTYDFTIPKTHCFFANNVLVHNTGVLEEHSDLVLILKWDYFYDRDEEKKNDFTIYVAKNKRGRTGKHHLRFYPQYSRFGELPKMQEPTSERYV